MNELWKSRNEIEKKLIRKYIFDINIQTHTQVIIIEREETFFLRSTLKKVCNDIHVHQIEI